MTKYTRLTGKVFGSSAIATGNDPEIGQFGSALAGTYNGTTDVSIIQSLPAWQKGFISAVTPSTQFPPLPEMTGFGKVLSQQICYLLQQGIAEWDSGTTYYENNWCAYNGKLYISKSDENLNNLPTNVTYWTQFTGGSSRNFGEIVTSSLPIIDDNTLHLADGSQLSGASYPELLSYIASLYTAPTVTQYYAWKKEHDANDIIYTLSSTPNASDPVFKKDIENMVYFDNIYSVSSSSIKIEQSYHNYIKYTTGNTSISTFSQNYFTTEEAWQEYYTAYGECGKYVYNLSANTVRIPLFNSYFTNTVNTQKLGDLTEASLPNIKGAFNHETTDGTATGAFSIGSSIAGKNAAPGGDEDRLIEFNAGTYNSIYKDTATTVNTQSIKQLVYIVVAK